VEASDADAARQLSFDGSLHQFGREERQRDRQIDLSSDERNQEMTAVPDRPPPPWVNRDLPHAQLRLTRAVSSFCESRGIPYERRIRFSGFLG